jgi:short-subunit dehydrogenase
MNIRYFAGRTILITGASAGIGYEFARQLAPAVSTMLLVARRNERLEALESELKAPSTFATMMNWSASVIGWFKAISTSIF